MATTLAAKPAKPKKYDKWEIENAVDTLIRAEEIKKNNTLLKLARTEKKKRLDAIEEVKEDIK